MSIPGKTSVFFVGEIIADYQLTAPLKIRENSEIWCATRLTHGPPAAIKFFLHPAHGGGKFKRTAYFLQQNDCLSLIQVWNVSETFSGIPYMVMEYLSGGTLCGAIKRHGALPLANVVYVMRETLYALASLHSAGVVHRDVKPGNLWFSGEGEVRLGDLGAAKFPDIAEKSGQVFGTASYMSPEQVRDTAGVDFRSDFFSLGTVIYEALTGRRRYSGKSFSDILKSILAKRTDDLLPQLREYAPDNLAKLLARMMDYEPKLRPDSASTILEEMDRMNLPDENLHSLVMQCKFAQQHPPAQ